MKEGTDLDDPTPAPGVCPAVRTALATSLTQGIGGGWRGELALGCPIAATMAALLGLFTLFAVGVSGKLGHSCAVFVT